MKNLHNILLVFTLISMVFFSSCNQRIVFEQNHKLDGSDGWSLEDSVVFQHEFTDSTALYDIFLNVRNSTNYQYSNLYVFFQTNFPDGRTFRDTIEMTLADKQGKWTGKGFGKIKTNSFHFRKDVWFPVSGIYEFSIQHAMRQEPLMGISDVGIRIQGKK